MKRQVSRLTYLAELKNQSPDQAPSPVRQLSFNPTYLASNEAKDQKVSNDLPKFELSLLD